MRPSVAFPYNPLMPDGPHNQHGERIGRLETNLTNLSQSVGDLANSQRQQGQVISDISVNIQTLVSAGKASEGKFDVKAFWPIIVSISTAAVFLIGVYITPLAARIDNLQSQLSERGGGAEGRIATQVQIAQNHDELATTAKLVNRLEDESRQRLTEEAKVGRDFLYRGNGKTAPQLP